MTEDDLAAVLARRVEEAPKGEIVVQVHLFGIEFADELIGHSLPRICEAAGISKRYGVELNKMRNLAAYVELKR